MVASTTSTVRAHAKGLGRRRVSLAVLAGVAALPLLTMGITVPSAVAKSRAVSDRTAMHERLEQREGIARSLRTYTDDGALDDLDELHQRLVAMIPADVSPLDEFGALRSSASSLSIEIESVKAIRTHDVRSSSGSGLSGGGVQVDEVLVTLADSVDNVLSLVEELRRRGLPTLLLGFDLTREAPAMRTFQAEVRIGFIRRASLTTHNEPLAR